MGAVVFVWYANGLYLCALAERSALLFRLADVGQWILLPTVVLLLLAFKRGIRPRHYGFGADTIRNGTTWFWATLAFITTAAAFPALFSHTPSRASGSSTSACYGRMIGSFGSIRVAATTCRSASP